MDKELEKIIKKALKRGVQDDPKGTMAEVSKSLDFESCFDFIRDSLRESIDTQITATFKTLREALQEVITDKMASTASDLNKKKG